jgi:glycosyltransferase involved in cell wall biosynthesis
MIEGGKRLHGRPGDTAAATDAAPLITVATVVRNGARTLEHTIRSVASQTFRDFEYLVIDGASTDGTQAVIERHSEHIDYWRSEPDSGIYSAWNKALSLARGQWIAFLGADDTYCANALADYAKLISELAGAEVQYISSRVELIKNGKSVRTIGLPWAWPGFSRYMTVAHVGSLHHRSLFEEYGTFDEQYRACGDYEMLLRPRDALRAAFLDRVTARMTLGGISNANVRLALAEQERAKHLTGRRAGWICALEKKKAHVISLCRSLLASP